MHTEPTQTVLGVWAHPDDEAYLSAGLMLRTIAAGGRVVCVHATRGERGTDDPVSWPPERLASLRERELAGSLAVLGVREHSFLGYVDGECDRAEPGEPVEAIAAVMRLVEPDVVVTFGPDGITGHPDHIAVSAWTTAAWSSTATGTLLYAATTHRSLEQHRAMYDELGIPHDAARCIGDDEVALAVHLDPHELDRKRRCLAAHASQTEGLAEAMGEERYRRWYEVETFRRPRVSEIARTTVSTGTAP